MPEGTGPCGLGMHAIGDITAGSTSCSDSFALRLATSRKSIRRLVLLYRRPASLQAVRRGVITPHSDSRSMYCPTGRKSGHGHEMPLKCLNCTVSYKGAFEIHAVVSDDGFG
jgi:hypothetical protein